MTFQNRTTDVERVKISMSLQKSSSGFWPPRALNCQKSLSWKSLCDPHRAQKVLCNSRHKVARGSIVRQEAAFDSTACCPQSVRCNSGSVFKARHQRSLLIQRSINRKLFKIMCMTIDHPSPISPILRVSGVYQSGQWPRQVTPRMSCQFSADKHV